jgi:hypothetical protein
MSYSRTACRYSCWRTFRGDTTCRRAGPTERFSKKSMSEVDGSSFRMRIAASRSGFFGVYPRSMSFENSERSRAASAVLSGSPETETSRPRAAISTPKASSRSRRFSSWTPKSAPSPASGRVSGMESGRM